MKLLVCISQTPDTTSKISFSENNTKFNNAGVQYILNPYDEWYALVRAIELKEKNAGSTVTVLHVGTVASENNIRKALAIGADDAIRVDVEPTSALFIAYQIAEQARKGNYDIIFCGKETIDYNGSEVAAMVAELLDLPFVSYATSLELNGSNAVLERDIEGGKETVEVATPFVLSAAKGMAEQRIPNMQGIMMSKRKPLQVVPPVNAPDVLATVSYDLPPAKSACKMIAPDDMETLVRLLHTEAKVI